MLTLFLRPFCSKRITTGLCLLGATLAPFSGFADSDQKQKKMALSSLDFLESLFSTNYAPIEWKREFYGWDISQEVAAAKQRVNGLENISSKDFQREILQILRGSKDYHVRASIYSTEKASLPFQVKGSNGKYFIVSIKEKCLSRKFYHIKEGDELIQFDGRPVDEVISELMQDEISGSNEATDRAIAEMLLTARSGASGVTVPRGPVTIAVRSAEDGEIFSYQLIWDYNPEQIESHYQPFLWDSIKSSGKKSLPERILAPYTMLSPLYSGGEESALSGKNPHRLASKKSFIPPLGRIIWKTEDGNPFYAYLFFAPNSKLYGYVRIPHYMGDSSQIEAFKKIISEFEWMTDGLVIDQINNPGGFVFYMYALASVLTDQPLHTLRHRIAITHEEVAEAVKKISLLEQVEDDADACTVLGDFLEEGYPVNYQLAQFQLEFYRFIISEWKEKRFLTNPYFLYGVDQINPDPEVRYTKPILLLINSLDISCGDFFPAIMQDNERAVTLGSTTAGAGGCVRRFQFPNRFGIDTISITQSIAAERTNSQLIENSGVTPDVPYELTEEDLHDNYSGYVSKILETLINMK